MNYKDFFFTNNASGWKTNANKLIKNHLDIYNLVINHCDNDNLRDISFKEKVWHFINDIKSIPTCEECGKQLKFKKSLNEGYGKYCSKTCTNKNKNHIDSVKKTMIDKYNGPSPFSCKEISDKREKTMLDKYGVDNIFKDVNYITEKTLEKHGVTHIAKLDSTKNKRNKTNIKRYGVSTPLILEDNRVKGFEVKLDRFNLKYSDLNIINGNGDDINIICDNCNNEYIINRALLLYRYGNNVNPCVLCNPISEQKSIKEKELNDYIKSLNIDIIDSERELLNGLELDIYIASHNLAIEFNGLYWHNELHKDKKYHLNKTELCEAKGIQLIHVFEDEWIYKKDIVKSRLKNILGLSDNKIYGRKCIIKEVKTSDKTKFLDKNHIQGSVGSKVNLGLYYNDELVSIMTFGYLRKNLGNTNKEDIYELLRFCNKLNTNVIGGADKLLKYFIKEYRPKEIISYADRRWSIGSLYDKLGFEFIHNSEPNYFYIVNNRRKNRFGFRKDILIKEGYDSTKTEHEIMLERGIYRIYDCGTITYKLICS